MRFAQNSDREIGDWFLSEEEFLLGCPCQTSIDHPNARGDLYDRTGRDRGSCGAQPARLGARSDAGPTGLDRKQYPITTGAIDYFPDAIAEVAHVSLVATQQHHPGEPLHWDKEKSTDEADALVRHLIERGTRDTDGERHTAKVAWRALALLQREIEAEQEALQSAVRLMDSPSYPARCV